MIALAFAFVRDSWLGRIAAAILGILLLRAFWKHQGAAEEKDYIDKVSNEAATERRTDRDKIDLRVKRVGAADRLRSQWSRD